MSEQRHILSLMRRWTIHHTSGTQAGPLRALNALVDGPPIAVADEAVEVVPLADHQGAVDLIEQARFCVTAALNCPAHPWHGSDQARRWLMDASSLGGGQ